MWLTYLNLITPIVAAFALTLPRCDDLLGTWLTFDKRPLLIIHWAGWGRFNQMFNCSPMKDFGWQQLTLFWLSPLLGFNASKMFFVGHFVNGAFLAKTEGYTAKEKIKGNGYFCQFICEGWQKLAAERILGKKKNLFVIYFNREQQWTHAVSVWRAHCEQLFFFLVCLFVKSTTCAQCYCPSKQFIRVDA